MDGSLLRSLNDAPGFSTDVRLLRSQKGVRVPDLPVLKERLHWWIRGDNMANQIRNDSIESEAAEYKIIKGSTGAGHL